MKDLVFLSGWGFDQRVFQPVVDRLAGRLAAPLTCGWSLGAMRAMQESAVATCNAPHGVRLVLVGATPRFTQASDWPHAQPPELLASFATAVAADPVAALCRFATLMNHGDERARELSRQTATLITPDAATLGEGLAELAKADLRKSVAAIRQPVLLVHGERDPLMPLAAAEWLAAHLPNARLEVFAGAAHAPFLSQPDRFADLLIEFARD